MLPLRHPALVLLALTTGSLAQASVGFQVWNPTTRDWTLVPTAEGPLGTCQYWDGEQLGIPVPYRPRPGEGVPVPKGHSVRFYYAGPQGAATFHLCDHLWVAGQSADGGPANPHSVRLGLIWETPAGQEQPVATTLLDTAQGSAGLTLAQLGRLGGWSDQLFTLRAHSHQEPDSKTGAGVAAATGATAAIAGLDLDLGAEQVEVLDEGWVVPAGGGSGTGIQGEAGAGWGAGAGLATPSAPAALPMFGAGSASPGREPDPAAGGPGPGAGGAGVSAPGALLPAAPQETQAGRARLSEPPRDGTFQAKLDLFAAFIKNHPGKSVPYLDRRGKQNPLNIWLTNTRKRLATMPESRQAVLQALYDAYQSAARLPAGGAGAAARVRPGPGLAPELNMKVAIENRDQQYWRLWRAGGRAVPLCRGPLGSPGGSPAGFLDPDGLWIEPETWVELDYGKPATRSAGAWKHSTIQDCLTIEAGRLLFRHHLAPGTGRPACEFTFGVGLRAATGSQDPGSSRAEVRPDPDQKLASGILSWAGNRIIIHRQGPAPDPAGAGTGAGSAVESKATPGPAGAGEADPAPAAGPDWSFVPTVWAAGAGWAPALPAPAGFRPILPLEAVPLEPTGDPVEDGGPTGLATLFSLPDGFGDNLDPDQLP